MKVRSNLSLVIIFYIVVSLIGIANMSEAAEKVIDLSFSNHFPAGHFMSNFYEKWGREIEMKTGGKVKITFHHGGTLTSPIECYQGIVNGISDMGLSCLAYTRGRFPLMEVLDLPGYPTFSPRLTTHVTWEFYKKFRPKELEDVHVLQLHAHIPGIIAFKNKSIKTLEDLRGLKIRCTGLSAKIVKTLGAIPVAMSKLEQYESLQRGVVDGSTAAPNEMNAYKLAEVSKYSVIHPPVGYVTVFFNVMNLKRWNSLPKEVQKVFTDVSEKYIEYIGEEWERAEKEGAQFGKQAGHQFYILPLQEGLRWEKLAVTPLIDNYIKDMEKKGLPGKEAIEYRKQLCEKYKGIYPSIRVD
ncbi:MAG TPA: C4-dicarboxylate ABC transporter substrate-binding protein [Rikenellaceae bacterium]|nr:C4-dicarboxylate ABC transporter substrate-binding protein [Rikenellaceae bacterium]